MNTSTSAIHPAPNAYKDRRSALLVAGILEIVMGIGAWLMVALMFFSMRMAAQQGNPIPAFSMISGALFYGLIGLLFVVLGIGSIQARRWARALWVVFSAGWILVGVLSAIFVAVFVPFFFTHPPAGQPAPPPGMVNVMLITALGFVGVFMVVLPSAIFLFYRSRNVQATCEAAQTRPSWTDACSLPVLGAVCWLGVLGVTLVTMPFAYAGLFPFFGIFLRGIPGILLWLGLGVVAGVSAMGLYRQQEWAWWLGLLLLVGLTVSATFTYARADLNVFYTELGLPPQQLQQIEAMGFNRPPYMIVSTLLPLLPFIVLMLWARTSLKRPRPLAA